ncbi:glycosyltransferase family 4 protein [Pontiellaceae bacterium B1224]|nr:glycosyltransferase family 4 protein [Pontiellaceae bacterium B1224]
MNVVWLIQNLVPYHHARFDAFSSVFEGIAHLIQVTDKDSFEVLEFNPDIQNYRIHTLFPGRIRSGIKGEEIDFRLEEVLWTIKPDCVCASGWGMEIGQKMLFWALRNNVPVVMFSESTAYDEKRVPHKEWIKGLLVRCASAALVGGTPHREYIHQLGMPEECIFDGHNVVDSNHFSILADNMPEEFPSWLRSEAYFAVCTRFGQKKNLPRLVRAYAKYVTHCKERGLTPIRLIIGGDGETRADIESEISRCGIEAQVYLLGSIQYNALPWFYQNCSAFIHASTTEQWGLVVNEAMAAGAPLLLSKRCGCAPNLLEENQNGFSFDPSSEESISNALFRFTQLDAEERAAFGQFSQSRIKDWGAERFADNLAKAVNHAIKVGPVRNPVPARFVLRVLGR